MAGITKSAKRETAKYVQLADTLRHAIADNRWAVGDQLPTVDLLSEEHKVSRITVRQAMDILEREKLITRGRGRGTHVIQTPAVMRKLLLKASWHDFRRTNSDAGRSKVIKSVPAASLPEIRPNEGIVKGPYQHLVVIGYHDRNLPLSARETFLQRSVYQRLKSKIESSSMLDLLGSFSVKMKILDDITTANPLIASQLDVPVGTPVLRGRHIGWNEDGQVVFVDFSFLRGDYVKFEISVG